MNQSNNRKSEANVDPIFIDRWSPRSFSSKPVPNEIILSLFEAARWAPSAFNDQPWLFLYTDENNDLNIYRSLIVDQNRIWADKAPVLAFVLAKKHFSHNNQENASAKFDTGAAWMSIALQARKHGLYTHSMGGIHRQQIYEALNIPKDEYEVICAMAIGYIDDPGLLPPDLQKREQPNERKPLNQVYIKGKFKNS